MSNSPLDPRQDAGTLEPSEDTAAVRDVAAWVTLLLRTIKTCRLYDAANPAAVRFRLELAEATGALLDRCGTLKLDIQSSAMLCQERVVFESTTRDDNLPGVFHRDGVRALTLLPGITPEEVQSFLDVVMHVSGPMPGDDDLVTLLWEANLPHVEVSAVPLEGDVDGGDEDSDGEAGATMPWPGAVARADITARPSTPSDAAAGLETRSDDWNSVDGSADPEEVFHELEAAAAVHVERFELERRGAHELPLVTAVADILGSALAAAPNDQDRAEIGRFIPRLLREAIGQGEWHTAADALRMLRECTPGDAIATFLEGITTQPSPITKHAVAALDRQSEDGIEAFIEFAQALGEPAVPWLMHILSESQQKRTRQPLVQAIAALAAAHPDVLLPWLSDERWYVVRNVVHIFSRIGGDGVGNFVQAVARHPEPRVRREVVEVLAGVDVAIARPMLTAMLEIAEPRLYITILQKLAQDPGKEVDELLLATLSSEAFERRTPEEQRAILMALATRGDMALPALETELNRGGLFSRGDEPRRQAVAFCIARIGTPAALALLETGLKSGKSGVKKACTNALNARGGSGA
jgi:HEAT repeat protein